MKRLLGMALLLFAAFGFLFAAKDVADMHGRRGTKATSPEPLLIAGDAGDGCRIDVFFFYGNAECPTCDIIREEATQVIESLQKKAHQDGPLHIAWNEVNVEEPGNEHYILDYGLYTTTVVLSDRRDPGRWKRLDEVWGLASNKSRLSGFIDREISEFAEGCE